MDSTWYLFCRKDRSGPANTILITFFSKYALFVIQEIVPYRLGAKSDRRVDQLEDLVIFWVRVAHGSHSSAGKLGDELEAQHSAPNAYRNRVDLNIQDSR
jgi:hypothetical protein